MKEEHNNIGLHIQILFKITVYMYIICFNNVPYRQQTVERRRNRCSYDAVSRCRTDAPLIVT